MDQDQKHPWAFQKRQAQTIHRKGDTILANLRNEKRSTHLQRTLLKKIDEHPFRHAIKLNWLMQVFVVPRDNTMFEKSLSKTRALESVLVILDSIKREIR